MKKRIIMLWAALALLLCACGGQAEESAPPEPSPSPVATAGAPLEDAPAPTPSQPAQPTPEELLARQPIDDTHDAFLVPTGGELGTLLVTAEKGGRIPESELGSFAVTLSVWDPRDLGVPIQTMDSSVEDMAFGTHEVVDANFDGHMDFSCMYFIGNQPNYWYLWVWDEEAAQFTEVPEYTEISSPRCDPETEVIDGWARNSGAGDGTTTFHRWEDGKLVCVRRIETWWWEPEDTILTEEELTVFLYGIKVEDRIGGELTQVYYKEFPPEEDFFDERAKWEHLDYHGEN